MKNDISAPCFAKDPCLNEEDFYNYVTRTPGPRVTEELEFHLSSCSRCRQELAELIKILYPDPVERAESIEAPSENEIEETFTLIQDISRDTTETPVAPQRRYFWPLAAAAAVLLIISSSLALHLYWKTTESNSFYALAKTELEEVYAPESPSGLRLQLPFRSAAKRRDAESQDALDRAENLFFQALAIRHGMPEAHLGLASVYLSKTQFSKARAEFQKVLDVRHNHHGSLIGRGVAFYEEGLASKDSADRTKALNRALEDFNKILAENPAAIEARYNRALVLYESGRHKEALQEIETYLSRDTQSLWAEKLRTIQSRIRMTRAEAVEREVDRASLARDAKALAALAHLVPYQVPSAIRGALRRSLAAEGVSMRGSPDLQWASAILAAEYASISGDLSYQRLLDFYAGLSPPQRREKKSLDAKLRILIKAHRQEDLQSVLRSSYPLERKFEALKDHWQLVNLYHLRGNCFYYSKADFSNALIQYRKMLRSAERSGTPDLVANALGAVAAAHMEQRRFDQAIASLIRMKELAAAYRFPSWTAFASKTLGIAYLNLNKPEESLREFSQALAAGSRLMDEEIIVEALEGTGAVMERTGHVQEARNFYTEALLRQEEFIKNGTIQATSALEARRLNLFYKLGDLALRTEDLTSAEARFRESLNSSLNGMRELEGRNRLGLAQVYLRQGKLEQALLELRATQSIASSGEFPEIDWQVHSLMGSVSRQKGEHIAAYAYFQRAIQILEQMRNQVSLPNLRQSFLTRRFDPYREIVSLLSHSNEDKRKVLEYVDRAKSMTLREHLAAGTSLSGQGPFTTSRYAMPLRNSATLEYFLTSNEIIILVSSADGFEVVCRTLSSEQLEQQVTDYLQSINRNDTASFASLSRTLYDELVGPIASVLDSRRVETLMLLPDGPLHTLPFGGLKSPAGQYLLEKYSLAYAPSRSILHHCLSKNRGPISGRKVTLLLLDGSFNLTGASEEVAYLSKLHGRRGRLVDGGDLGSLSRAATDSEIVHFSGHAIAQHGRPSLVLRSPQGKVYLEPSQIDGWELSKNYLVNLAGCSTGIGPRADGETPWGLLPAFLNAGAPAIVVSLLPVEDASTRNLNLRFYELLASGSMSKARALQQAQLSILNSDGSTQNRNPLSWTPYVLVGDPR